MKLRPALLLLLAFCFFALPAFAQNDIYDNGPTSGTVDAWSINFGFVTSDAFTIGTDGTTVNGLQFVVWMFPGDVLDSAEVVISSSEFGGTVYFDGTVNFTEGDIVYNQYGFKVANEIGTFAGVTLNAGTYWLNLENAVVNDGDPVYWDENSGPSLASQNSVGTIPSESFTLLGTTGTSTTNETTPEPGSGLLLVTGAISAAGLMTRKFF